MVNVLNSGPSGLGSSHGQGIVLCSWARHFTLKVPLSIQTGTGELKVGGNPAITHSWGVNEGVPLVT